MAATIAQRPAARPVVTTAPAPRRVPVAETWPGRPETIDGTRAALVALQPDAPVLLASLREWTEALPAKRNRAADVARQLAGYLAWNLQAVPRLVALLTPPPVDPTAAATLTYPDGAGGTIPWRDMGKPSSAAPLTGDQVNEAVWTNTAVSWWPMVGAGLSRQLRLGDTPTELWDLQQTDVTDVHAGGRLGRAGPRDPLAQLTGYLATRRQVWRTAGDLRAAWQALSDARTVSHRQRRAIREQVDSYRRWGRLLDSLAPRIVQPWTASIHTSRQALSALAETEGLPMPSTLTTPAAVTELAAAIRAKITEGTGGRIDVAASEVAFPWSTGLPATLLSYVNTAPAPARHIPTWQTKSSTSTGAPIVAEGAAKSKTTTVTGDGIDLAKYVGGAELTTEQAQFVANIEAAISSSLVTDLLRGVERDLAAELVASAGVVIGAAADLAAGILEAKATIPTANVLALSPADFVTLFSAQGAGGYLNFSSPEAGPGTYLGLAPCVVPSMTAGTVVVADGRAVTEWEVAGAPLVAVDCLTQLSNNKITVYIETWAAPQVSSPGSVAAVTVGP